MEPLATTANVRLDLAQTAHWDRLTGRHPGGQTSIRPPRTVGGMNLSREHPVVINRPPRAGTLANHARREMRLFIV